MRHPGHLKSRNREEKSGPSIKEDAWQPSTPSGKSQQGVNPSVFGVHRDIGDPGDKWLVHFEIAICETPISGGQLSV
jgi:hypothetical protein